MTDVHLKFFKELKKLLVKHKVHVFGVGDEKGIIDCTFHPLGKDVDVFHFGQTTHENGSVTLKITEGDVEI